MKEIKAWGLEEIQGGRKGKLITGDYVPFWHPVKNAVFVSRSDAITYMRQAKMEDKLRVVRLKITIEKEKGQS